MLPIYRYNWKNSGHYENHSYEHLYLPVGSTLPLSISAIENEIDRNGSLRSPEKGNPKAALNLLADKADNKLFLSPVVFLTTNVTEDASSQNIFITAQLIYNEEKVLHSTYEIYYNSIVAGAEGTAPGEVQIIKQDNSGNKLEGVKFQLQILNATGISVSFPPADSRDIIRTTGTDGMVVFKGLRNFSLS